MAINKGILTKDINGVMEFIFPKTSGDIVIYDETHNVNQMIKSLVNGKADHVAGKGLSTNDFTNTYKNKLDAIIRQFDSILGGQEGITVTIDGKRDKIDNVFDDVITANKGITVKLPRNLSELEDGTVLTKSEVIKLDNGKVDKRPDYDLSKNDFTDIYKSKLDNLTDEINKAVENKRDKTDNVFDVVIQADKGIDIAFPRVFDLKDNSVITKSEVKNCIPKITQVDFNVNQTKTTYDDKSYELCNKMPNGDYKTYYFNSKGKYYLTETCTKVDNKIYFARQFDNGDASTFNNG